MYLLCILNIDTSDETEINVVKWSPSSKVHPEMCRKYIIEMQFVIVVFTNFESIPLPKSEFVYLTGH